MKRVVVSLPFVVLIGLLAFGAVVQWDIARELSTVIKESQEPLKTTASLSNGNNNTTNHSSTKLERTVSYVNEEKSGNQVAYLNGKSQKSPYSVDWHYITDGGDGKFTVYVDVNSFRRADNIVTFWQKWVYNGDQRATVGTARRNARYESGAYREERKKTIVDCWNMESGVIFEAFYTEDNIFVWGNAYENPIFTPDVPDTFSYAIAEFVCGEAVPELDN